MATYSRRERVTRRIEFTVPASRPYGACWTDVMQAINAAEQELRDAGRIRAGHEPPDDMIRILTSDDELAVYYETEGN